MRTITRVYDTYAHAQRVVSDLEASGVPSDNISLVANRYVSERYAEVEEASAAATGAGLGAALGGGAGLLAGIGLLAIPGLGPVVAAGWLAATAVGAIGGATAGGLVGALIDSGTPEEHAHVYSEAVRRGGTMVTVRADDRLATNVETILNRHSPIDPVSRGAEYRKSGWTKFDASAPTYRPSEAELERMRRNYQ